MPSLAAGRARILALAAKSVDFQEGTLDLGCIPLKPFACLHVNHPAQAPNLTTAQTSDCKSRIDQISPANSFKAPLGLRAPSTRFLLKCLRFN